MSSNFYETAKYMYTADWKEKTEFLNNRKSYFPKRYKKKTHLICKFKLPQKSVTWKRINNEGYFLCHLFCF